MTVVPNYRMGEGHNLICEGLTVVLEMLLQEQADYRISVASYDNDGWVAGVVEEAEEHSGRTMSIADKSTFVEKMHWDSKEILGRYTARVAEVSALLRTFQSELIVEPLLVEQACHMLHTAAAQVGLLLSVLLSGSDPTVQLSALRRRSEGLRVALMAMGAIPGMSWPFFPFDSGFLPPIEEV